MNHLGVDISKRESVIAHYCDGDFVNEFIIQNNQNGFNYLLKYLDTLTNRFLIFESTGIYSRSMVRFCQTNKVNFVEINPLEAKFKTSSLRAWKTDKSDAHKLAMLATNIENHRSSNISGDIYFELRERVRFHLEMERIQTRLKVEIVEALHQTFPGLEKLFKNRYSIIALNIAMQFPHPEIVKKQDLEALIERIFNSTDKGLSLEKAANYAKKLITLANESYPNVDKHSFLAKKVRILIQQLKHSIIQMKELDEEMIQLAKQLDCFEAIYSIPGIGTLTTAMIIGEIGDITQFKSHKQLNAYVGIDIKRYQSGATQYRDTINKRGNKNARKLLFWVVMNIIRGQRHYDNHIIDYYYKLKKQPNEKSHKTAVVACMNRLIKTIHYLVTNNKQYDYQMSPH
ncbi:IS110 family transposase [Mammaliicoccus sciuri]|uniref:IS110 family transposase n=1 Tax=Mammaliicoccus sciuri TaxID=1296 RepID=UPI002E29ED95|nr:IS110 family transposase [Mammaliicoccus sciuri]